MFIAIACVPQCSSHAVTVKALEAWSYNKLALRFDKAYGVTEEFMDEDHEMGDGNTINMHCATYRAGR